MLTGCMFCSNVTVPLGAEEEVVLVDGGACDVEVLLLLRVEVVVL